MRNLEKTRYERDDDGHWRAVGREITPREVSQQRHKVQAPNPVDKRYTKRRQPIDRLDHTKGC